MKTYPENNNTARVFFFQISESADIQQQSDVSFQKFVMSNRMAANTQSDIFNRLDSPI